MDIGISTNISPSTRVAAVSFSAVMLAVTVIPFIGIWIAPTYPVVAPGVDILLLLASTHVFTTGYLLTDPSIRTFVGRHPVKMIAVPLIMIVGGALIFSIPATPFFVAIVLAFYLYQAWHFGAQNIGVASFVSFSERGTPLTRFEKRTIRAGVICGMFGVLKIMAPAYMIGPQYMPVPKWGVELLDRLYTVGFYGSIPIAALALFLLCQAWRNGHLLYGLIIFLSVTFLFAMYVSTNVMLGFMSFVIAHGLQYLIFLGAHSLNRQSTASSSSPPLVRALMPPVAFVTMIWIGHEIWTKAPVTNVTAHLPTLGLGLLLSLSLAHFWIDQYLWRMKNPERAAWVKSRFRFMFAQ